MPELPESYILARQMHQTLAGKKITDINIFQPKCLNRSEEDYYKYAVGRTITGVKPLGKWLEITMDDGARLLISLGMGGELIYMRNRDIYPEKTRFLVRFFDGTGFYVTL